jgi:hypothetical protein
MEADASPLPMDETTPPVVNTYFVVGRSSGWYLREGNGHGLDHGRK